MNLIIRRTIMLAGAVLILAVALVALMGTQALVAFGQDAPGTSVKLDITGVTIGGDRKPVVSFNLTDERGSPIRLTDVDANSLRFTIARIETDATTGNTVYLNYIINNIRGAAYSLDGRTLQPTLAEATQPGVDTTGVFADQGSGRFTYTFGRALPEGFNGGITHTVGGYVTRNARANVSNDLFDFVPNGGAVTVTRQVVNNESCNKCHDDVQAHGGTRHLTGLCVLCHTPQTIDPETSNTVDFKVLIHKLHSGADLPSVEAGLRYLIVGFRQGINEYSEVVWPQDTRNCQNCHQGPNATNFKTNPSLEACSSCHDDVNFATGQNHAGGPQTNSASCKLCHPADGPEFGPSVAGAHVIPVKSSQLRGVDFTILGVTNTRPGQNPTVTFNIKNNAGQAIQPSEMASLAFVLAGPTTDFATPPVTESATNATATADGNFSYTFRAAIPATAAGTFAVGVQGGVRTELAVPGGQPISVVDVGRNDVFYFAVTDAVAQPRKNVVDINNCNQCHDRLAFHGGSRVDTEYCVLCHNPTANDLTKRTTAGQPLPPQSVTFNFMIHKIHTGEEQQDKPYIIVGGSPASPGPIELSEALFPTDRRNCTKCHVAGSNLLSFMRQGVQPTALRLNDGTTKVIGAVQSVCNSCHDSAAAVAHADTQSASPTREACVVCHNEDRDFAVSKSHPFRITLTR